METKNQVVLDMPKSGELTKGVLVKIYADPATRRECMGIAEVLDGRPKRGLVSKTCRIEERKIRFVNMNGTDLYAEEPCYALIQVERNRPEGSC